MTELERLRDDVRCLTRARYSCDDAKIWEWLNTRIREAESRIAALEAEQADPWRVAKEWIADLYFGRHDGDSEVVRYVRHLEAENAKLKGQANDRA